MSLYCTDPEAAPLRRSLSGPIDELYPELAIGTALRSLTDGQRVAGTEWWPRA